MRSKYKLIRITTVPVSLDKLLGDQLRFMQSYYDVTAISSDKDYLERVGVLQNISVFHVEMTRKITPIKDLIAVYKLYNYFKKEKPFIVHTHTPKAGTVGMIAAKLARVPNRLHTVAGLPLMETFGLKRKLLNIVEKVTYHCATKIYPNSYGLKEIIVNEKFCPPSKLDIIGVGSSNGINTAHFSREHYPLQEINKLRMRYNISQSDFVFVFVGRLVSDKGINELIRAFKLLSTNNKAVKLILVGPLEAELDPLNKDTIQEIEGNDSIITIGFQSDVRPYFAISDCLVFPSYREGFPNVVMQAGAMGLSSIVTNINGCNEIIIEGENGTIIPPKDKDALFIAMKYFVEHKDDVVRKMAKNARLMILSRYEQTEVWNALLKEYQSLVYNK